MNRAITYVALLRGVNVGGRNLIKMPELARIFKEGGFNDARTYIQIGNIIFSSRSTDPAALTKKIERALMKELGYPVAVILRTLSQLEALISREPFKKFSKLSDVMLNAVFFKGEPERRPGIFHW